jgi:site-specific DNA-methyltransferase (adenine-specific)
MDWIRDNESEKIHPTQKPVKVLENLIEIFTDPGEVVIDPCAGSGSTLVAAENLGRKGYGFEIKKDFFKQANKWIEENRIIKEEIRTLGFAKTELEKINPTLF